MTPRAFAIEIVRILTQQGFVAYWAGGCVRDLLLGKPPKDYDVATDARPETVQKTFGPKKTKAVGAAFGVILVHGPKESGDVEVATFRSEGPYLDGRRPEHVVFCTAEEDAKRRDFTINGIFFDPLKEEIHDFVEGREDLERKVIRAIGDPLERFREDKLRMLRAVRFTSTLGFSLDPVTLRAIQEMAKEIHVVSAERITQELKKMLLDPNRAQVIPLARTTGLLGEILPELPESADDRLSRILGTIRGVEFEVLLAAIVESIPGRNDQFIKELGRRFRLSNEEGERTEFLVSSQKILHQFPDWKDSQKKRLLGSPWARDLIELHRAIEETEGSGEIASFCLDYLESTPNDVLTPPPLINGNDLRGLGFPPGPAFREILEGVRDAQLNSEIQTREEALELALRLSRG